MLQTFKYWPLVSALLLATGILSACGKKGPLYLPETPAQQNVESNESSSTVEKSKTSSEQQPVNNTKE